MELFVIRLVGECTRHVEVLRSSFTFHCTLRFFIIVDVLSLHGQISVSYSDSKILAVRKPLVKICLNK